MKKQNLLMIGLLLGVTSAFVACSSDDTKGTSKGAGEAGEAGEAGAAGAGVAGELGIGAGGLGIGAAGEGGAAGATALPAEPLNPQAVIVTAAEPTTYGHLLVAGTDYLTTEGASVNLAAGTVDGSTTYASGDVLSVGSAGLGFALDQTNDKVDALKLGKSTATFDLKDLGNGKAVTVANKAYVPVLSKSFVTVLDLNAGTVAKRIDLSTYNAAGDSDGSADIDAAVYDPSKKIAYFVLGRIDFNTIDANLHLPCSTTKALLIGIDATTDDVVDLNGDTAGEGLSLSLTNPRAVSLAADGSLIVVANGCYDGATLKNNGIEVADPTTGSSQVVFSPSTSDYLNRLILLSGSNALLESFDSSYATHWNKFDLASGTLGAELTGVPDSVSFDGTDLLGVGTGGAVQRYDITTGTATTVSATSWVGKYSSSASTSLVK